MFDAWNAVDFSPSGTLSGIGDSLMPAVEGLASLTYRPGRGS